MQTVGLKLLKNKLSEYVRLAAAGETIIVTDRGRPVAEIRPPAKQKKESVIEKAFLRIGFHPIAHGALEGRPLAGAERALLPPRSILRLASQPAWSEPGRSASCQQLRPRGDGSSG